MKRLSVSAIFAMVLSACSSSPTSSVAPGAPRASFVLSGEVVALTSTGLGPVEGVRVQADSPVGTLNATTLVATTGKDGLYSLTVDAGVRSLVLTRPGYVTDQRSVTINADTRLDILIARYPTYSLSGVVSEATATGLVPVEGVEVYCDSCGEYGHTWVSTDANGLYIHPEAHEGHTPLYVRKAGYVVVDALFSLPDGSGRRDAMVNGNTRFDIQVVRR